MSLPTQPAALEPARQPPTPLLDARSLARRILDLPPLPAALAEAMRVLSHDEVPAQECVRAIERDPTLAMRVLQLANSGFYASPSRVANLGDAVRLLGLRAVGAVLAAVSIKQMLGRLPGAGKAHEHRWRHALATGCAARELARERGTDAEEAFVAGLLHDVGAWLLAAFAPGTAVLVQALQKTELLDLCTAERRILGMSHADIGAQVAEVWHFPPDTAAAIAFHHRPRRFEDGGTELEWTVCVAHALTHELEIPGGDAAPGLDHLLQAEVRKHLGLDQSVLARVRERTLVALTSQEW